MNQPLVQLAARLERFDLARGFQGAPCADKARSGLVRAAFAHLRPPHRPGADAVGEPVAIPPRLPRTSGSSFFTLAAGHGWTLVEPMGVRAADLVLERYRTALR